MCPVIVGAARNLDMDDVRCVGEFRTIPMATPPDLFFSIV